MRSEFFFKNKQRNTRERQHEFRPEFTSSRHMWLINYDERTSTSPLALGYPLISPFRHVRTYYCMSQSSPGFLCSDPSRHETFRPLFRRPAPSPLVLGCNRPLMIGLGCSRPLIGNDAEGSEVVQETPHPLFSLGPHTARPPTISPNITHFGSLVSSIGVTNPANKIRLLRKVASVLSLSALISVSR